PRIMGLPDRRAGLQVQPHRHRRGARAPPARARREHAPGPRTDRRVLLPGARRRARHRAASERSGPRPRVASLPDPRGGRSRRRASRHRHRTAAQRRGGLLGPLASAAHAPLLRGDVRIPTRRLSDRGGALPDAHLAANLLEDDRATDGRRRRGRPDGGACAAAPRAGLTGIARPDGAIARQRSLGNRRKDGHMTVVVTRGGRATLDTLVHRTGPLVVKPRGLLRDLFDRALAAAALGLLAPLFALVALLIRLDSRGPVFFRHQRVGRDFRPFGVWKFRTMRQDAPAHGGQLTVGDDPRVTRIGRLLRQTKIDELPQLINVLVGEMNLVGPRPEVRQYVDLYLPAYRELLQVRPGLTDLAALAYRNEAAELGRCADP